MRLSVGFPHDWDIPRWEAEHQRGERPDTWPYGLDRLRGSFSAQPVPVSSKDLIPKLRRRARSGIALGWDESSVARLVSSRKYATVIGGVIWNTDEPTSLRDRAEKQIYRKALSKADALWCLSRPQVGLLREALGNDAPPIHFLRFGIDAEFFAPHPLPQRPLIVSAGGDRDRDTATLFDALARVKSLSPEVKVVVQSASSVPAPSGITKIPRLSHRELSDLYARATVVAIATHPNVHVSGMTVALEAMSTGRPVVISDTAGIEDYVPPSTGVVCPPGDSEQMSTAILSLVHNPERARELGAAGREHVLRRHTTAHMTKSIAEIISSTQSTAQSHLEG